MRIRYKLAGKPAQVKCDLPDKKARELYKKCQAEGTCEWAELVGEEDENYMDVLEFFDRTEEARRVKKNMDDAAAIIRAMLGGH